jgi:hypothetical protein
VADHERQPVATRVDGVGGEHLQQRVLQERGRRPTGYMHFCR